MKFQNLPRFEKITKQKEVKLWKIKKRIMYSIKKQILIL